MAQLSDFIQRNIPKMKAYYRDILVCRALGLPCLP